MVYIHWEGRNAQVRRFTAGQVGLGLRWEKWSWTQSTNARYIIRLEQIKLPSSWGWGKIEAVLWHEGECLGEPRGH